MKMVGHMSFLAKSGSVKHKVAAKQNDYSDCNKHSAIEVTMTGHVMQCDLQNCQDVASYAIRIKEFSVKFYGKENTATSLNFLTRNFTKLNVLNKTCLRLLQCFSRESLRSSKTNWKSSGLLKFEAPPMMKRAAGVW